MYLSWQLRTEQTKHRDSGLRERERESEGGREGGREGERERGREGERERVREGERERGREGERERGREGEREREGERMCVCVRLRVCVWYYYSVRDRNEIGRLAIPFADAILLVIPKP